MASPSASPDPLTPFATGTDAFVESGALLIPHGFEGVLELLLPSSHRTVPFVSPAIKVVGFGAAGRAGKAPTFIVVEEGAGLDTFRDGVGDGLFVDEAVEVAQGTGPTRPAPARFADAAGRPGKGVEELMAALIEFPQLPFLLTADCDD